MRAVTFEGLGTFLPEWVVSSSLIQVFTTSHVNRVLEALVYVEVTEFVPGFRTPLKNFQRDVPNLTKITTHVYVANLNFGVPAFSSADVERIRDR